MPTLDNDCPQLLFIVMAYNIINGNCLLCIPKGIFKFDDVEFMRGKKKNHFLTLVLVITSTPRTWVPNCVTISLLPF